MKILLEMSIFRQGSGR